MANKVKAIILTGNGTNCEMEMAHACRLAGADHHAAAPGAQGKNMARPGDIFRFGVVRNGGEDGGGPVRR